MCLSITMHASQTIPCEDKRRLSALPSFVYMSCALSAMHLNVVSFWTSKHQAVPRTLIQLYCSPFGPALTVQNGLLQLPNFDQRQLSCYLIAYRPKETISIQEVNAFKMTKLCQKIVSRQLFYLFQLPFIQFAYKLGHTLEYICLQPTQCIRNMVNVRLN